MRKTYWSYGASILLLLVFGFPILAEEAPNIDPLAIAQGFVDLPDLMGHSNRALGPLLPREGEAAGRSIDLYPGWPNLVDGPTRNGGIFCNLDHDDELEIVFNSFDMVCAWNLDGSYVSGWPNTVNLTTSGAPSFGDVDGDGKGEIVVGTRAWGTGNSGWLHVFEQDGSNAEGFPIALHRGGASGTPALADIDGDGVLEIVIGERDWPEGFMCVYNGDGTMCPGWPQPLDSVPGSAAAVGDITGDGVPEIVGESYFSIYAFAADGTLLDGFPYTPGMDRVFSYSTPVLADLDGDGKREIICGNHDLVRGYGEVYVLRADGGLFPGWPRTTDRWIYASPAVGDIDQDGLLDIVVGDQVLSFTRLNHIYAWNADGTPLPGFPLGPFRAIGTQTLIFDLDDDGQVELVFDDNSMTWISGIPTGYYHAYNHDGSIVDGWPVAVRGTTCSITPFVADLNLDGMLDFVGAGKDNYDTVRVYAWNANEPVNADLDVLTVLQYNVRHDGVYDPSDMTSVPSEPFSQGIMTLDCEPNPFNLRTQISFTIGSADDAELHVFDINGRRVRNLPVRSSERGGNTQISWDGRNNLGEPLAAGVYFLTVSTGSEITGRGKVVLLR